MMTTFPTPTDERDVAQTPWLDDREQRAWRAFVSSHVQLDGRLRRALQRRSGISDSDYAVLVSLSEAPGGQLRAFELGKTLQWEKSRLSHHLRRMEQRGLVDRAECETDRRGAYLVITPRGRATIAAAAPEHAADVRRWLFDALTPAQVDALADVGETVLEHLARLDAEPGAVDACVEEACADEERTEDEATRA